MSQPRMPEETGVPEIDPYLHPVMKKNYGDWKFHDRPRPGVLRHVANSGDELWTVRAGTPRQMDVTMIRELMDIADDLAEGYVRFTSRSNIEYMVSTEAQVKPLMDKLTECGYPIGGTGNSV
ncbi:MAG: dissimilatory-type sulfite reductase subunit beta, partial [Gammaproteobacteria bacterium]|nr:dissimilatory-type sulfite reductase subunit beta [Gammaproteobacteria bacterium]